ncbi:hypothetical protein BIU87_32690 [Streptomyces sp. ZS0098]|nr:hypothetical protein BIU87_32690 [Streptomyces sp. ZS0098]
MPTSQQSKSLAGIRPVDELIDEAPGDAWQRLPCGDGAKGPRLYDWAAAKPGLRPVGVETAEPARVADSRPAIEECFQATKNECGLDEYEVRRCPDRYRHITLARDCCMIG